MRAHIHAHIHTQARTHEHTDTQTQVTLIQSHKELCQHVRQVLHHHTQAHSLAARGNLHGNKITSLLPLAPKPAYGSLANEKRITDVCCRLLL